MQVKAGPVCAPEFKKKLDLLNVSLKDVESIAVAVSGGGDSMALLYLLAGCVAPGMKLHALTVDHGLRSESRKEAEQVARWVKDWPAVTHKILTWRGAKPQTKIAETARAKRYELLARYCQTHGIQHLFLAHTADDQAETFLMRLAAGSGVDGLACMQPTQAYKEILLCRPLLSISHARLLQTLRAARQKWIEDPTNKNKNYARPRLRAGQRVLAREGLTPERLGVTAVRMARARRVCEDAAAWAWNQVACAKNGRDLRVEGAVWDAWLPDTQIRILMRMIETCGGRAPRLEQIEALHAKMVDRSPATPLRATLAGCLITSGARWVKVTRE